MRLGLFFFLAQQAIQCTPLMYSLFDVIVFSLL